MKVGYANFRRVASKLATIAMSLEQSQNKFSLIICIHMSTSSEHLFISLGELARRAIMYILLDHSEHNYLRIHRTDFRDLCTK